MMLKHCYSRYLHWNEKRPLLTKCATASTLMGLGDLLCQNIETSKSFIPPSPSDSAKRHALARRLLAQ